MTARVLVVAEHDGQSLSSSTAKCVSCARSIPDAQVTVAVCAADGAALAAEAAALEGVHRVLRVDHPANANLMAAILAPQIVEVSRDSTHVLGPSTTFGRDLMPRVAALLDVPHVSDIMSVESATRFRRPIYAGNVLISVEIDGATGMVGTVRVASFAAAPQGGAAMIDVVRPQCELPTHTRLVSAATAKGDRPDLQTASRVVSGGRALGSAEGFQMLYRLADLLGAAVGASRAAVDAGYAPNELQIGQTGKIIAPELYFAIGISGAIQHLTGIKDARTIAAINKDPEAPIFEVADIALVGDLFQIVPELERLVSAAG